MKLSKIIEQSNQNADFTGKFDKNKALHKKLMLIGGILAAVGFAVAAASFILIGVFGADLFSIQKYTALLISMFVLLVIFAAVFAVGLYILRQAQKLHLEKTKETENKVEITPENTIGKKHVIARQIFHHVDLQTGKKMAEDETFEQSILLDNKPQVFGKTHFKIKITNISQNEIAVTGINADVVEAKKTINMSANNRKPVILKKGEKKGIVFAVFDDTTYYEVEYLNDEK